MHHKPMLLTFVSDSLVGHWNSTRFYPLSRCLEQHVKLLEPSQTEQALQCLSDHQIAREGTKMVMVSRSIRMASITMLVLGAMLATDFGDL
jgi:hypothetical protein